MLGEPGGVMSPVSRGFRGRRSEHVEAGRVPPGQYVTNDFPVLSAGPTPHTPLEEWSFTIHGDVEKPVSWPWQEFLALPTDTVTVDIHCVTKWSKLDTSWKGVSLDTLLERRHGSRIRDRVLRRRVHDEPAMEDVTDGKAWVAYEYGGSPLEPEHGGPARLLVPHLYFWKSAKWVRGLTFTPGRAGVLGDLRLPQPRRPMAGAALPGRLNWQLGTVAEQVVETARTKSIVLDVPEWRGHQAGQHVDVRLTAEDGYEAQRSYSIASAPEDTHLELTVERLDDGEVSPYLVDVLQPGDELELRGPIGGYFVWEAARATGAAAGRRLWRRAVPLDAAPRAAGGGTVPMRLVYSSRTLGDVIYRDELLAADTGSMWSWPSPASGLRTGAGIAGGSTESCCASSRGRRIAAASTSADRTASSR